MAHSGSYMIIKLLFQDCCIWDNFSGVLALLICVQHDTSDHRSWIHC